MSSSENDRPAEALRVLVATAPDSDTNTLIVTHKPNIRDAFGKDWFEIKEGEASIFKPEDGRFALVARDEVTHSPDRGRARAMAVMRPNVMLQILSRPATDPATTAKRAWPFSAGGQSPSAGASLSGACWPPATSRSPRCPRRKQAWWPAWC